MVSAKDLLLVVLQIAPAVIISAGINFAVAYAMYHNQSTIYFFPFPNTIAGDLAVTNFIQGALNYIVPNVTLEADNRAGRRLPWRGLWNPSLSLVDRIARSTGRPRQFWDIFIQSQDVLAKPLTVKIFFRRFFLAILRGLFIAVFLFLITWSLAVAIACPIYCGKNIGRVWAPQAIKGIYGGVHALLEIPAASFLIVLGIDVRNHASLPTSASGAGSKPVGARNGSGANVNGGATGRSTSAGSSHVGLVQNNETGSVEPIDTRTNSPL